MTMSPDEHPPYGSPRDHAKRMVGDRSTGVQRGRGEELFPAVPLRRLRTRVASWLAPWLVGPWGDEVLAEATKANPPFTEPLDDPVEAVSPEPRPTDEELLGRLRRLLADDERRLGPVPESVMREVAESWPAEPRKAHFGLTKQEARDLIDAIGAAQDDGLVAATFSAIEARLRAFLVGPEPDE